MASRGKIIADMARSESKYSAGMTQRFLMNKSNM